MAQETVTPAPPKVLRFPEHEPIQGHAVMITGHMPDREGRKEPRFPDSSLSEAEKALREQLDAIHSQNPIHTVMCSGTAGADLLAVEWALDHGTKAELFLPYIEADFVASAVGYGANAGRWRDAFRRARESGLVRVNIPTLESGERPAQVAVQAEGQKVGSPYQHFVDINFHMLDILGAADRKTVVALWDGKGGDTVGGTEHAIKEAVSRGANYRIVYRGVQNIASMYPMPLSSEGRKALITAYEFEGQSQRVSYLGTSAVTEGVECDVYEFEGDKTKDLGIIRISAGAKTPLQRVLKGDRTVEAYISGRGRLVLRRKDATEDEIHPAEEGQRFSVDVHEGDTMRWEAADDSGLVVSEVCFPPYEDGRYENLPE